MARSDRKRIGDKPFSGLTSDVSKQAKDKIAELSSKLEEGQPKDLKWTALDGTGVHTIYQEMVDCEIDDTSNGIEVYNNEGVNLSEGVGKIDTLIAHKGYTTIVDYKTHDMTNWTLAYAERLGREHGQQVKGYVDGTQIASGIKGYIIAVGRLPRDAEAKAAYVQAVAEHGVDVKFTEGGEPEDVVKAVREAMQQTEQTTELKGGPYVVEGY